MGTTVQYRHYTHHETFNTILPPLFPGLSHTIPDTLPPHTHTSLLTARYQAWIARLASQTSHHHSQTSTQNSKQSEFPSRESLAFRRQHSVDTNTAPGLSFK